MIPGCARGPALVGGETLQLWGKESQGHSAKGSGFLGPCSGQTIL